MDLLSQAKDKLIECIPLHIINGSTIQISARGLTPEEAIGNPGRTDYPILNGKEVMIEANCDGALGQAFTDSPIAYQGGLSEILAMPINETGDRALFVATLNAVLRKHQLASKTIHCKDKEPELCSKSLMPWLKERITSNAKIGLIGLQPAMLEELSATFGPTNLVVSDLNPDTIGKKKWGVTILDGSHANTKLINEADFVLVTGSSIVNGSFNQLHQYLITTKRDFATFGNTISGVASLLAIPHICFFGH